MNIEEMTIGQIREIQEFCGTKKSAFRPIVSVGQKVFIRTVTHHYTGEVTECNRDWLELKEAAWIADDGRFNNFLKTGAANEVEPFEAPVRIPLGGIIDVTQWIHALPRAVK